MCISFSTLINIQAHSKTILLAFAIITQNKRLKWGEIQKIIRPLDHELVSTRQREIIYRN